MNETPSGAERAERAEGSAGAVRDEGGAAEIRPLPRRRNSWPVFVILGLALVLPLTIVVGSSLMGGAAGERQFEALFSSSASERAAALDYWSVTFRGSEPRLYNSTLVEEELNERMRTAPAEAVLDFDRVFAQDPDYLFHFRPTAMRALALRMRGLAAAGEAGEAASVGRWSRLVARFEELVRTEESLLAVEGPSLTAGDHERASAFVESAGSALPGLIAENGQLLGSLEAREGLLRLVGLARAFSDDAALGGVVGAMGAMERAGGGRAELAGLAEELEAGLVGDGSVGLEGKLGAAPRRLPVAGEGNGGG